VISGAQDSIGIVMPGVNYSYYEGTYWPTRIDTIRDEATYQFIEQNLYLIPLDPRTPEYNPLDNTNISMDGAKALADATEACWRTIHTCDVAAFGTAIREASNNIDLAPFQWTMKLSKRLVAHTAQG
jgi:hypothetical protein